MTPPEAYYQQPQSSSEDLPREPENRTGLNRTVAVIIGGTTLAGVSVAALTWGMSRTNPDETALMAPDSSLIITKTGDIATEVEPPVKSIPAPVEPDESVALQVPVASVVTETEDGGMDFQDAFRSARAQLGPDKFFQWNGGLYSTAYKEEWEEKSEQEQKSYLSGLGVEQAHPTSFEPNEHQDDSVQLGLPLTQEELNELADSPVRVMYVEGIYVDVNRDNIPDIPLQTETKAVKDMTLTELESALDDPAPHDHTSFDHSHEANHAVFPAAYETFYSADEPDDDDNSIL